MDNIIELFKEIPTTAVSDAMSGMNNLDSSIKPLKEEYKVVGRAYTVQMPVGDNSMILRAFNEARPGDVIVVDAKGDTYRAIAGDFMVSIAQTLGIQGIVVDGVIRDIVGIKALDFPVFSKGTTVAASAKSGGGQVQVPISCGGVTVHPGDLIVGDADGVVVIPREKEEDILAKAKEKMEKDERREQKVAGNPEAIREYLNEMIAKLKK